MHGYERGVIRNVKKAMRLFDHSDLIKILPRKISPSNTDMILDNNGAYLFIEWKEWTANWNDLSYGQRSLYQGLVVRGRGADLAVCVKHRNVDMPNSLTDVEEFQVMYLNGNGYIAYSPIHKGIFWKCFIDWFYNKRTITHAQETP